MFGFKPEKLTVNIYTLAVVLFPFCVICTFGIVCRDDGLPLYVDFSTVGWAFSSMRMPALEKYAVELIVIFPEAVIP